MTELDNKNGKGGELLSSELVFDGIVEGRELPLVPDSSLELQVPNNEVERKIYRLMLLHPDLAESFNLNGVASLSLAEQKAMLDLMYQTLGVIPIAFKTPSSAATAEKTDEERVLLDLDEFDDADLDVEPTLTDEDFDEPQNSTGAEEELCPECSGLGQTGHALAGWKKCLYCHGIGWI